MSEPTSDTPSVDDLLAQADWVSNEWSDDCPEPIQLVRDLAAALRAQTATLSNARALAESALTIDGPTLAPTSLATLVDLLTKAASRTEARTDGTDWVADVLRKMSYHTHADHVLSLAATLEALRDELDETNAELAETGHARFLAEQQLAEARAAVPSPLLEGVVLFHNRPDETLTLGIPGADDLRLDIGVGFALYPIDSGPLSEAEISRVIDERDDYQRRCEHLSRRLDGAEARDAAPDLHIEPGSWEDRIEAVLLELEDDGDEPWPDCPTAAEMIDRWKDRAHKAAAYILRHLEARAAAPSTGGVWVVGRSQEIHGNPPEPDDTIDEHDTGWCVWDYGEDDPPLVEGLNLCVAEWIAEALNVWAEARAATPVMDGNHISTTREQVERAVGAGFTAAAGPHQLTSASVVERIADAVWALIQGEGTR